MDDIDKIIFNAEENALFRASCFENIEIAKYLIELGTNVNLQDNDDNTPLFYAPLEIMKLLVDAGANINHMNNNDQTVLSKACKNGDHD